jgi:DinB superfamily
VSRGRITRPTTDEYAPYYGTYINKVPERDLVDLLSQQIEETSILLASISEAQASMAYATGKWSIKEVVGHLSDTERIIAYRALRIARGDVTPLPGFEQDDYVRTAGFDSRQLADLIDEFRSVRAATLSLLCTLDATALQRHGVANGMPVSVRALAYIIAGHERHHVEILRTRYLAGR